MRRGWHGEFLPWLLLQRRGSDKGPLSANSALHAPIYPANQPGDVVGEEPSFPSSLAEAPKGRARVIGSGG
jgi:hypothetical protein